MELKKTPTAWTLRDSSRSKTRCTSGALPGWLPVIPWPVAEATPPLLLAPDGGAVSAWLPPVARNPHPPLVRPRLRDALLG